jgi:hypothetical protein
MSDNPISQPQLSQATIDYNRSLLTPQLRAEHPAYADLIERSLAQALAASGQDKPPQPDTRSSAQQYHDMRYGISPGALPPYLSTLLETGEADQGRAAIENTGRSYAAVLASATAALTHGKSAVDPRTLSAAALVALASYSDYIGKWAANRPKE